MTGARTVAPDPAPTPSGQDLLPPSARTPAARSLLSRGAQVLQYIEAPRRVQWILDMHPLGRLLHFFFWHFYHGFARTYDFVADVVSIGRWNDWMQCAIPFVRGQRILELGYGPGHLQIYLREQTGAWVAGLDESMQMAQLANEALRRSGHTDGALTRGVGQALPFADGTFDTVVSTFPTEYIFEAPALHEIRRVLGSDGRFVVVPAAWIIGRKTLDRVAAWLFRVTDQAPRQPAEIVGERLSRGFEEAGLSPEFKTVEVRSSMVLIVIARPRSIDSNKEST